MRRHALPICRQRIAPRLRVSPEARGLRPLALPRLTFGKKSAEPSGRILAGRVSLRLSGRDEPSAAARARAALGAARGGLRAAEC